MRLAYTLAAHMAPDMFAELKKGSAETLILALLEEGPRHGYELARLLTIARAAGSPSRRQRLHLALSSRARWLHRGPRVEKPGQRRRRFYRLTATGRRQLAVRRNSWREFVGAVDIVLKPV